MGEAAQEVIVVAVPLPAQSHLSQLLHFSLHLSSRSIPVHFCSSATHNRQAKSRIQGWPQTALQNIHFHDLPIPPFSTPPPNPNSTNKFPFHLLPSLEAATRLRDPISSLLRSLAPTARRLVVLHDPIMSFAAHDAASLPNAVSYRFQNVPAFCELAEPWSASKVDKLLNKASKRAAHVLAAPFPGSIPREIIEFAVQSKLGTPKEAGVVFNTCRSLEGEFVELLAAETASFLGKRIFTVGPINLFPDVTSTDAENRHECLWWLDKQPAGSVVLVSFGSTTTLSDRQIEQLALGLQKSGQRFVWVLRDADRGDVFDGEVKQRELPLGFEKAVEGVGLVIRGWAPQLEILAHPATGAFMSHCGWNSSVESLSMGVPIIAWPMHSDQPRNALMLTDYLAVAVAVREWTEDGEVVSAAEVEEAVRKVMVGDEGKEIRKNAMSMRFAMRAAIGDGGSSKADMDAFIEDVTR